MKRIILFFTVCLGLSVSQTTFAGNATTVRAASKRPTTTVSTQQTTKRTVATTTKRTDNTQNSSKNLRTATKPQQRVVSRTTTNSNTKPRETETKTTSRTASSSRAVTSRQAESKKTSYGNATSRTAASAQKIKRISRATELNNEKIKNIKSLDYSKCKSVYYECMDEFCANKDTNLRRCACSSRIHEFDSIKKQLSNVEDKMLDFNQRLLTVSLDKGDAAAINVATEGELAFSKKDTSESEKLLKKITESLNDSGNSKINNNLSPVSLSLNIDTAWDDVDSTAGIATSAKSGLDLYNAAGPVCVEMAREVCTDDELVIAQNGYKLTIQQDCDTVAKAYKTQYNSAKEKIHESSALLDMSRLNVHQQHNSDDTLTCKKKILDQLSNTSVCGENLYKCLDTSGKYIDPSTGNAFLSVNLYELKDLLQEPTGGEKWSKIPKNESFVNFLNSKKKFLEPAINQCQGIADMVWKDFLDDALAQIKLAQNEKLESIRQSCTSLVAECKIDANKTLSDFDARALSTFSIAADKTANKMCAEIETTCNNLMNTYNTNWQEGMSGIATDISYQKIIDTCTQVGRDCIVQQCNGTSGNFALCQKATDERRRAILNRKVCWDKVFECVSNADNLDNITILDRTTYYQNIYNVTPSDNQYRCNKGSITENQCACTTGKPQCTNSKAGFITEQIWGNCELIPDDYVIITPDTKYCSNNSNQPSLLADPNDPTSCIPDEGGAYKAHNKILTPKTGSSLLSWFADNTGTANNADSCSIVCPLDYKLIDGACQKITARRTSDSNTIITNPNQIINITNDFTSRCDTGIRDIYGNCCTSSPYTEGNKSNGICVPDNYNAVRLWNLHCTDTDSYMCPALGNMSLYCVTQSDSTKPIVYYADNAEYECGMYDNDTIDQGAMWIIVDENGNYYNVDQESSTGPYMSYMKIDEPTTTECFYKYIDNTWKWANEYDEEIEECTLIDGHPTENNELLIKYY